MTTAAQAWTTSQVTNQETSSLLCAGIVKRPLHDSLTHNCLSKLFICQPTITIRLNKNTETLGEAITKFVISRSS